jgi:quercetin dioxygenase-like cupin family protein
MKDYIKSNWIHTDAQEIDPKLTQQVFRSENLMAVRYVYEPGVEFPEHSHPQEQVTIVRRGELLFTINGEEVPLKKNDICAISPNIPHKTKVLSEDGAETLSIFTPIKENVIIDRRKKS